LREFQEKRLRFVVRYAYDFVPFYHRKFRESGIFPGDIKNIVDLKKLPIITKDEFRSVSFSERVSREFVGSEDFVLAYGDTYFKPYDAIRNVLRVHSECGACISLLLDSVDDPSRFGLVKVDQEGRVLGIVEKPSVEEAKLYRSDGGYLSIGGLLVLKPEIFDAIMKTKKGKNGEVWLTDSVEYLRNNGKKVYGCDFHGSRYDIGTFDSLKEADRMEHLENHRS